MYGATAPQALHRQVYSLEIGGKDGFTNHAEWAPGLGPGPVISNPFLKTKYGTRKLGGKRYELTDHLGNVRVVISDIRQATISGNVVSFATDVKSISAHDRYFCLVPG